MALSQAAQERLKKLKIQLENGSLRTDSGGENDENTAPVSGGGAGEKTEGESGFSPAALERLKKLKEGLESGSLRESSRVVDNDYISAFITDSQGFYNKYGPEYEALDYGTVMGSSFEDYLGTLRNTESGLSERSRLIRDYLNYHRDQYDDETYNGLVSYLDNFDAAGISGAFSGMRDYYSQWETEDQYNFDQTHGTLEGRQKWYEDQQRRIAQLESERDAENAQWSEVDPIMLGVESAEYKSAVEAHTGKLKAIDDEISAIETEIRNYERGNYNSAGQHYGSKVVDDYFAVTERPDFGVTSASRDYRNASREDLLAFDMAVMEGHQVIESGGSFDEAGNILNSEGQIVHTANRQPVIEDKLGMFLSGGEEGISEAYTILASQSDNSVNTWANLMQEGDLGGWKYLTEQEIGIYYALMEESQDMAYKFLSDMKTELNRRQTLDRNGLWKKTYDESGLLGKIALNIATVPVQLGSGVAGMVENVANMLSGKDINPYSAAHAGMHMSQTVRGETAQDLDDTGVQIIPGFFSLGDLYQSGMSMADSLLAIGVGGVYGGAVLAMGAADSEAVRLYEQGASTDQIAAGAALAGAAEMVFESLSIDKLIHMKDAASIGQVIKNILIQGGVEASEEAFTEIANTITNAVILGQQSDWAKLVDENGGNTFLAFMECVREVGHSALSGFFSGAGSGGIVSGANGAVNYAQRQAQYSAMGKPIRESSGGIDSLRALANDIANESSLGKKISLRSQAKVAGGPLASNRSVGRLYNTVRQTISEKGIVEIASKLEEQGVASKRARSIAGAVAVSRNGMELTDEQKSLLSEARRDPKIWDVIEGSISDGESTSAKWGDRIAGVQSEVVMDQVYKAMASDPAALTDSSADSHYDVSTDGQALDSDGNAITIKGVSSIEKDKMVLETEDGAVDASGVSYASTGDALVYEAVASLGGIIDAETANKLLKRYDGSTDAKVFARGVVQAYTYGFYGYDRSETIGKHTMSAELTREQRNTAYGLGQLYRQKATQAKQAELEKRKTEAKESGGKGSVMFWGKEGATDFRTATEGMALNEMQETAVATMEKLSAALGINFYVYQSYAKNGTRYYIDKDGVERKNSPNGYYDPATGSVYIDLHAGQDAKGTMLFTMAHELSHFIHQWSPAKFKKLADILFAQEGMKGNVAKLVARKQAQAKGRGKPISYAVAYEEVVADAMESILTSGNVVQFMADVKRQDRSLWKKICDWFKNLADDLKALINAYKDVSPDSVEGKAVAAMGDVVSELEKSFAEGLVDAAENHQAVGAQKNTTDDGGVDHDAAVKNSDRIVDQIRSSLTKIMALDSVYTIDSSNATPYTSDWKTDEKSGHEVFKSQGSAAYRPGFGKVILSKKGAVQSLYHGNGPAKQAVFPAIKAVIEQGIEIGRDYNHNNQGFDTVTFSAPIDFFGDKSPLAVVVKVYESRNADKTFYIHEICDSEGNYIRMAGEDPPKKSSSTNLVDPTSTVSAADGGNTSKNSIRNDGGIVKADIRYSHRPGDGFEEHDIISAVYGIRNEAARRGHDLVKIGTMPVIYQNLFGLSGDVFVSNEHLYQNMVSRATAEAEGRFKAGTQADYHELGEETVVEAIEQFQNPIAIMESLKDYKEPRLVAILDEKGNDGQNLIAVMRLYADLTSPDTNHPRNHVLLTIYEKRSLPNYIELTAEKNRVLHIRKGVSKKTVADLQLVGTEFKETLKRNVARFNAKVKEFKKTNGIFYSERPDTMSDRAILAEALRSTLKHGEKSKTIADYLDSFDRISAAEQRLAEINAEIQRINSSKGKKDTGRLRQLREEAIVLKNNISTLDKKLLRLRGAAAIRRIIEREFEAGYAEAEAEGKMAVARVRTEMGRAIREGEAALAEAKADAIAKQKEQADRYRESREKAVEQRKKTAMKQKIRKVIRDLGKLYSRGKDQRNVKQEMRDVVAYALASAEVLFAPSYTENDMIRNGVGVAMTTEVSQLFNEAKDILAQLDNPPASVEAEELAQWYAKEKKLKAKLNEIKAQLRGVFADERARLDGTLVSSLMDGLYNAYAALEKSDKAYIKAAYDPGVLQHLQAIKKGFGAARVSDMRLDQLDALYNAYSMVLGSIREANKAFTLSRSVDQTAQQIMREFGARKMPKGKLGAIVRNISNKTGWDYEKLYYALDRIGSDTLTELFTNLANSENIVLADVYEAEETKNAIVQKYGYNEWAVDREINQDFVDATGKTFRLTLGELMSLYAYSRREGAWNHIEVGGFTLAKTSVTKVDTAETYKLSKEQCEAITSLLTDEQRHFVEEMQAFLSDVMGAKGNEVSMLLYGIELFGEKNYFPVHIDGRFMANAQESQAQAEAGFSSMTNAGFTQMQNKQAVAPFVMESFMSVWADHVNEMSRYHGTVPALEDIRRVMNYSAYFDSSQDSVSVKAALENRFGKQAVQYFVDLYREANSGAIADKMQSISKKMLSMFRKNSVAYSASVLIQQPASLARAYALIPKKYFRGIRGVGALPIGVVQAFGSKAYKNTYAEMLRYAPGVTLAKEIGGFDTASGGSIRTYLLDTHRRFGQSVKTNKHGKVVGFGKAVFDAVDDNPIANLPNVADKIAWIEIWNACKNETLATHKNLAPNSEEFMRQVGKRFTEVIRATQVYDSIFAKSPMLKNKNLAVQYLVSFMNEPNTVANMAESATRHFLNGDLSTATRMVTAIVRSTVFTCVLKSIVYALRDDDEDETYIEKYIGSLVNNLLNDITIFNYIPVARDVWSVMQGYDVERPDMAVVSDAISSLINVTANAFKDTSEMTEEQLIEWDKKVTEANWKLVDSVAAFFGIPIKNIRREINAVKDHARIAHKNAGLSTWKSIDGAIEQAIADASPVFARSDVESKTDKLYDAIISGDTTYVNRLKNSYLDKDGNFSQSKYDSAVRKALRENDPRIREAAIAQYNGDPSERVRIARLIVADGFSQDNVVAAINTVVNSLKPEETEPTAKKKGYYTAADFAREIASGDYASAKAAREDVIQTAQKNGKSEGEAQKSFISSAKTELKELFLSKELSKQKAVAALKTYCGMDDNEIYWLMDKWQYEDDTGTTDGYAKYGDFYTAVQTGMNLKAVVQEYTDNGVEAKTLASEITEHFKPLYRSMSNTERAGIKGYLLNAYALLGYDRDKKSKDIDDWLKD